MRYSEISESPLGDYSFHGSPDEAGSLQKDDIRAAQNPKWAVKLAKSFATVDETVNVVLINSGPIDPDQDGNQIYPDAINLSDWSGNYAPESFKTTFGFLPPDYQSRINIILVSNEGDERMPMTPWMVAHRFCHALGNSVSRYTRRYNDEVRNFNEFFYIMGKIMRYLRFDCDIHVTDEVLFNALGTFASARNRKIVRSGEFIIELATQYFLKGDFDFRLDRLNLTNDAAINRINGWMITAKDHLEKAISGTVGKLIVF